MKKHFLPTLLLCVLILAALPAVSAQEGPPTPSELCASLTPAESAETYTYEAAEDSLTAGVDYLAVFCTTAGPIVVDLYEEQTPLTVNNFVFLAETGYFNNTNFHRVIPDFMAQGGDWTNTGSGGPGYTFGDEIVEGLEFDRPGLLAMANAGPGTNGSQFFITTVVTDWLNGNHTIFGEVLAGQANVLDIRLRDPQQSLQPGTMIETIAIIDDPDSLAIVEVALMPVSDEDVADAFAALGPATAVILDRFGVGMGGTLSDMLALDESVGGQLDTEAAVAAQPEAVQEDLAALYADHDHQGALAAAVRNIDCDLAAFPVYDLSYTLDLYPSAEEAAAALTDERLAGTQAALGLEAVAQAPPEFPVFTGTASGCDADDLAYARAFEQRGRFVATMAITITADNAEIVVPLLVEFTQPLFEDALHTVLRPEIVETASGE